MASLERTPTAGWNGDSLIGQGVPSTQGGVFEYQPYSFQTLRGVVCDYRYALH